MKKLKLDADTLRVDSVQAGGAPELDEGTVHGHDFETRVRDSCGWTACCPETSQLRCSVTGICA